MPTDPKIVAKLSNIVETVATEPCELSAFANDSDSNCPKVYKDSTDDWCLSCAARQALAEYLDT